MRFCITGGSGFIGSYFCRRLAEAGHEIVILDLIDPPAGTPDHRFVKGDIRDPEACLDALEGCDRVLHLAAAHHDFGIADETYFSVNESGTKTLCDAMVERGVNSICFYSTVALYGDAKAPIHEGTAPNPQSPYGASKLAGEKVLDAWANDGPGRRTLIIRPTVTFGPENFANMYSLIRQIHGGRFVVVGKGENIKSLSYVENIVDATLYLMDKDGLPPFDVYNYVEKPDLCSRDIAGTIYEALGKKPPSWRIPMFLALLAALPFDIVIALTGKNLKISSARVKKLFAAETKFEAEKVRDAGFEPEVELTEGIRRMTQWYVERGQNESAEWHQPPADPVRRTPVKA